MSKFTVMATWDDAPHLDEKTKKELWDSIPPFQRDARTRGIPQLGSGAIYPVPEAEIVCDPMEIPKYWPRVYGMDVGWNRTAVIWAAHDQQSDTIYLYSEHYRGGAEPPVHASAIKARGSWIPGVIDPAAGGRSQIDGERLIELYDSQGLFLSRADNSLEAGIQSVWDRLSAGRLKVFSSLQNWFAEFRIYRRDEKGKVVRKDNHLMDATRYLLMSGLPLAMTEPPVYDQSFTQFADPTRSSVTGY